MNLSEAQAARKLRAVEKADALLMGQIDVLCDGVNLAGEGNAKRVSPAAREKLKGIIQKYAKSATPFRDCVRDNTKRFGPERVKAVCGVVKALGKSPAKKVGFAADACPIEQMDDETFSLLHEIAQTDYMAALGQEA